MNVFDEAIQVLEDLGWTKGHLQDGDGVCLMGAYNMAVYGQVTEPLMTSFTDQVKKYYENWEIVRKEVQRTAGLHGARGTISPISWNDNLLRRKRHVIRLLQRCSATYNELHPEAPAPQEHEVIQLAQKVLDRERELISV